MLPPVGTFRGSRRAQSRPDYITHTVSIEARRREGDSRWRQRLREAQATSPRLTSWCLAHDVEREQRDCANIYQGAPGTCADTVAQWSRSWSREPSRWCVRPGDSPAITAPKSAAAEALLDALLATMDSGFHSLHESVSPILAVSPPQQAARYSPRTPSRTGVIVVEAVRRPRRSSLPYRSVC